MRRFYSEAVRISLVGVFRDVYVQNGRASEENERDVVAYVPPISKKKKLQKLPLKSATLLLWWLELLHTHAQLG